MKSLGENSGAPTPEPPHGHARAIAGWSEVLGNERVTALAGAVFLVLIVVELATVPALRALMEVHIFVGVLLVSPLVIKLGSTGYRFMRYYTGSIAFVRKRPPRLALRMLAPLLVATTLLVVGSGIALLVTGPVLAGPVRVVHILSALVWLPFLAVHLGAYLLRSTRLIADDWRQRGAERVPGRSIRFGGMLGALVVGAVAAVLVLPVTAVWNAWIRTNEVGPGFFIVGMLLAALAVLASRPLWQR